MDRLFENFVRAPWDALEWNMGGEPHWMPAVDLAESEEEVTIRAEVPGMDPKELDIAISGDHLVISGEKHEEKERKEKDFYHKESRHGSFRRSIPLPTAIDADTVEAECANGVVTIHLKKIQATPTKRIPIQVK
jgi:HSP20 family protein